MRFCWSFRRQLIQIAAPIAVFALLAPAQTIADGESTALTPDQQAIIGMIAKSAPRDLHYMRAPTDPIGEKVTLPLHEGKYVTLLRKSSVVQKDGSVTWSGTVEETGERAVLMLWGNA